MNIPAKFTSRRSKSAVTPSKQNIDPAYEACEGVSDVLEAIRSKAPVILISGRAGTGKSRLIHYLGSIPDGRNQIVVAPTGIAALNVSAATIHSTFSLPFGPIDADNLEPKRLGAELSRIKRLVIDEISMVRADMLDAIDARLRDAMNNDLPFGGVQIVMVGDFLQLPPVVTSDDQVILDQLGYRTPYAFSAKVLADLPLRVVTLMKVWRQNDAEFISVLGNIRDARRPEDAIAWLNSNCHREAREKSRPMMLTPTRRAADDYNAKGIENQRRGRRKKKGFAESDTKSEIGEYRFEAALTGSFEKASQFPVPQSQPLLPGVRVMAVRNDPAGHFVNGSLGTVLAIDMEDDEPVAKVKFDGAKRVARVSPVVWEDIRYTWAGQVEKKVVGTYKQIPLVLGYATTIHKSQGLTLEDVRIDLGRGAFAPGQLYVALSRAKTAEGLSLAREITPRDVLADPMLIEFLQWARNNPGIDIKKTGTTGPEEKQS